MAQKVTDSLSRSVPASPLPAKAQWSYSVSASTYLVPDDTNYVQPAFTADRNRLHLEARYNYEDRRTGSAWIGYNLAVGERVTWEFTPMLGGVFGRTTGIAPGYRTSLGWWRIELFSEGELLRNIGSRSDSYFYSWSEAAIRPAGWFRFGAVAQRTRAYQAERDIQRGFLVGVNWKSLSVTANVFNADAGKPLIVLSTSFEF